MIPNRPVRAIGQSTNEARQRSRVIVADGGAGIHAVCDLMSKLKYVLQASDGLHGGTACPFPCQWNIRQAQGAVDQVGYISCIRCVKSTEESENISVECWPWLNRRNDRTQDLQAFPHQLLDVRLPCRDTQHQSGPVERSQFELSTSSASSQLGMSILQVLGVLKKFLEMCGEGARGHVIPRQELGRVDRVRFPFRSESPYRTPARQRDGHYRACA